MSVYISKYLDGWEWVSEVNPIRRAAHNDIGYSSSTRHHGDKCIWSHKNRHPTCYNSAWKCAIEPDGAAAVLLRIVAALHFISTRTHACKWNTALHSQNEQLLSLNGTFP